jgi:hypothetical protein
MSLMGGFQRWTWRGERIDDIEAWAAARGEQMVAYHGERQVPIIAPGVGARMITETDDGEMPESFWNGFGWHAGWHYAETGRRAPMVPA